MNRIASISVLVLILAAIASPTVVSAKPNNGSYNKSSEAFKRQTDCMTFKELLKSAEAEADKRVGTKGAERYAKEADKWWAVGERLGCSWAK